MGHGIVTARAPANKITHSANKSSLNLHDLNVPELILETGASDTEVILPAVTEYTFFKVQSGAAR